MSIDSDTGSGRGGSYINLCSRNDFYERKINTEALAIQQGYKSVLTGQI